MKIGVIAALALMVVLTVMAIGAASAQEAAPAAAAPASPAASVPEVPAVAPMNCVAPKIPQRFSVAREDIQYLEKQTAAYGQCVTRYIEERQAQVQKYSAMAQAEADAGNRAAKEINEFYAQVKALKAKNTPKGTISGVEP